MSLLERLGKLAKKLFIEDQYVEPYDIDDLARQAADGGLDIKNTSELVKTYKDLYKNGKIITERVNKGITLTRSDREKDSSVRTDETMENITKGVQTNGGYTPTTSNVKSVEREGREDK